MGKEVKVLFFIGFCLIFFQILVSAESCNTVGELNGSLFCNSSLEWQTLKADGISCLNSYECASDFCNEEGFCGDRYAELSNISSPDLTEEELGESLGIIPGLFDWIDGKECDPGETKCEGIYYVPCGSEGTWENSRLVNGQCGYSIGTQNPGGGSSICKPVWTCTAWSDLERLCGTRTCTDIKNCNNITGKPKEVDLTCLSKNVAFCGDNVCDLTENEDTCSEDCGLIELVRCGDGICNGEESSLSCVTDCEPVQRKSRAGIFWGIVAFIMAGLLFVGYMVVKKIRTTREEVEYSSQ